MKERTFLTAIALTLIAMQSKAQARFETIGDLPGGFNISHAHAVSSSGEYVTGTSQSVDGIRAVRWSRSEGLVSIPRAPQSGDQTAGSVSQSGLYYSGVQGSIGFVWSESLGSVSIGDLPGGRDQSSVGDINDSGVAVGISSFAFTSTGQSRNRVVKWSPSGGLEAIPLPGASDLDFSSTALGLLEGGRIVGRSAAGTWIYSEADGTHEMLPGAPNWIGDVNSDGTIFAGTASLGGSRAAIWEPSGETTLLPLLDGHMFSNFRAISEDGSLAVGVSTGGSEVAPVVWIDRGEPIRVIDFASSLGLDMTGWVIVDVFDVSGDGSTIVGTARRTSWELGRIEGFVLTIPGPGSALAVPVALAFLRRRR